MPKDGSRIHLSDASPGLMYLQPLHSGAFNHEVLENMAKHTLISPVSELFFHVLFGLLPIYVF